MKTILFGQTGKNIQIWTTLDRTRSILSNTNRYGGVNDGRRRHHGPDRRRYERGPEARARGRKTGRGRRSERLDHLQAVKPVIRVDCSNFPIIFPWGAQAGSPGRPSSFFPALLLPQLIAADRIQFCFTAVNYRQDVATLAGYDPRNLSRQLRDNER